jgi:hypothetical protein
MMEEVILRITLKMVTDALFNVQTAIRYPDDCEKELGRAEAYLEAAKAHIEIEVGKYEAKPS